MHCRILLVGDTVALESIHATLAQMQHVELRRAAAVADIWPSEFTPDAVIFDVTAGIPDCARACLAAHHDLLLLGLDLESHQVLLLSGAPAQLATVADLVAILRAAVPSNLPVAPAEVRPFGE